MIENVLQGVSAYITPEYTLRYNRRKDIIKIEYKNGDRVTIFSKAMREIRELGER